MKSLLRFPVIFFVSLLCVTVIANIPKVRASVIGDANGDGKVDGLDYVIWINHFNQNTSSGASVGDFNLNGFVDGLDYVVWLNNYSISSITPTRAISPTIPSNISGVPCSSLSGIEIRFPCSPLVAGPMPEQPSTNNAWAMFRNTLYEGEADGDGINERFSAVANPAGSGVVIRNQNLLSDAEKHTTVGTNDDLPNGSTSCSAFRWLWKNQSEIPQRGWLLVWQIQMTGSPTVAISTDETKHDWFFKTRNGSDSGLDIPLAPVTYGRWAYFVVCTHIADAPNGWTKIWFRYDGWPDVNVAPFYQRSGHDTYQDSAGRNTLGIYALHDGSSTSYYGYFDRFGRATTPQRAIQIAGTP